MKICFTADEPRGLESVLSYHFGRCPFYVIVDTDGKEVKSVESIPNPMAQRHNPGDLPMFMKQKGINMIVTGGMGPRAREYFESFGIKTVVGVYGRVRDVLEEIFKGDLKIEESSLKREIKHEEESDELERLKKEIISLREQIADLKSILNEMKKKS